MDAWYPGPDSIPPDACPGGWFIHVYDRHGVLVLVRALPPGIRFAEPDLAEADAELVTMMVPGEVCMVIYDGDTGARLRLGGGGGGRRRGRVEP